MLYSKKGGIINMIDKYVVTNSYHDTIEFNFENVGLASIVKEIMDYLREHSFDFDNEIEEDWEQYYNTFEEAQKAQADSILETFINETSIWKIPEDTNISNLTTRELIFDTEKYKEFKLVDVKNIYV